MPSFLSQVNCRVTMFMRVCMMLSGLVRSNSSEQSLKKFILSKYDVDVYCQAWYKDEQDKRQTQTKIQESYSPKAILMQPHLNHKKSIKDDVYPELGKIHNTRVSKLYNQGFSQLLGIKNVSETFDWSQYDFIIRARYDKSNIINFPCLSSLDASKFYAPGHTGVFKDAPLFFRDFLFIMPNTFKFYCEAFDYMRDEQFCNSMYQWQEQLPKMYKWYRSQGRYFYPEFVFTYMFEKFNKWSYFVKKSPEEFMVEYMNR